MHIVLIVCAPATLCPLAEVTLRGPETTAERSLHR